MIRYWGREIAGWILIAIGLGLFYVVLAILLNPTPSILEAPIISLMGIIVFRGGIHLLKVAVAARICLQAQAELNKPPPAGARPKKAESPWDW